MLQQQISPTAFYLFTTPLEERLLISLKSNPGSTISELARQADAHPVSTSKALSELERAGYLSKQIAGRQSKWFISNLLVSSILELLEE